MTTLLPVPPPLVPAEPPVFLLLIDVAAGRITVHGDLDRAHVHRLDEAVDVLRRSPAPRWSVDAAAMTFCDAGGLRGLVRAHRTAVGAGRTLTVTRPDRLLTRLLTMLGATGLALLPADDET